MLAVPVVAFLPTLVRRFIAPAIRRYSELTLRFAAQAQPADPNLMRVGAAFSCIMLSIASPMPQGSPPISATHGPRFDGSR
jgi:hypothetical protein